MIQKPLELLLAGFAIAITLADWAERRLVEAVRHRHA